MNPESCGRVGVEVGGEPWKLRQSGSGSGDRSVKNKSNDGSEPTFHQISNSNKLIKRVGLRTQN
jgi:hypothetical protein